MRGQTFVIAAVGVTRISLAQVQVLDEIAGPDEDVSDPATGVPAD